MVVTILGPFDTYQSVPELTLLIYWGVVIFWATFTSIILSSVVRVSIKSPSIRATVLSTILFTATYVPMLIWFTDSYLQADPTRRPTNLQLTLYVFVITVAIGGLVYQIERHLKPSQTNGPRIWRRLPDTGQADIVRLSSEGHFVWVHTETGVHRLRLRFADAVAEMDGLEGACVHRSHWVARDHVVKTLEKGNRPLLVMSDGAEIPVSRTYRREAEKLGLLAPERGARKLEAS